VAKRGTIPSFFYSKIKYENTWMATRHHLGRHNLDLGLDLIDWLIHEWQCDVSIYRSIKLYLYLYVQVQVHPIVKSGMYSITGEVWVDAVGYRKYITGTERRTARAQTVLKLDAGLQHGLSGEVPCFCSNISTVSTNQFHKSNNMSTFLLTRGRYSYDLISEFDSSTKCYEFSKITNRIEKTTILFIAHLYSETAVFTHFCTVYMITVIELLSRHLAKRAKGAKHSQVQA
jgi:hypothetical protein